MLGFFTHRHSQAVYSIAEQGFFSGANFTANILLARWMPAEQYGIVALVNSLSLTALLFYSNFMIEPMVVLGVANYPGSLKRYYKTLFIVHAILCVIFSAVTACAALAFAGQTSGFVLWLFAGTTPFILLIWLMRRLPYVEHAAKIAAEISGIYGALLIGLTLASEAFHILTPTTAVVIFSLSSFLPIARCASLIKGASGEASLSPHWIKGVIHNHWGFSRWLIAASFVSIPTLNVQTVITSYFLSTSDVGIFRAVSIFTTPATVFSTAVINYTVSLLVKDFRERNLDGMLQRGRRLSFFLTIATTIYGILLWILSEPLDASLYNGKYHDHMWLVAILTLIPIIAAIGSGWSWTLRAAQQTRYVFAMTFIGGILSLLGSAVLIPRLGLLGVAISSLFAPLLYTVTVFYVGRRWLAGMRAGR